MMRSFFFAFMIWLFVCCFFVFVEFICLNPAPAHPIIYFPALDDEEVFFFYDLVVCLLLFLCLWHSFVWTPHQPTQSFTFPLLMMMIFLTKIKCQHLEDFFLVDQKDASKRDAQQKHFKSENCLDIIHDVIACDFASFHCGKCIHKTNLVKCYMCGCNTRVMLYS